MLELVKQRAALSTISGAISDPPHIADPPDNKKMSNKVRYG